MRRRRFMKLMAASAAAVLAPSLEGALAAGTASAAPAAAPAPGRPVSAAIRKEIAAQKKSLADTLRVIRKYELPPGSRPAHVFRAERREARRARP